MDGATPLTPGYFLVGRPVTAYPETELPREVSHYRTWLRCQAMVQHFLTKWAQEYLQHLQASQKWRTPSRSYKIDDLVLLSDDKTFSTQWVAVDTYPGKDSLVRAVDIAVPRVSKPLPAATGNWKTYASRLQVETTVYKRAVTRLAKLLPEDVNDKELPLHLLQQDASPPVPPPPPPGCLVPDGQTDI